MVTESFYKDVIKFADSTDIYGWNRSTDLFLINWWCRMRSYQVNFVHESDHQAGFVIGMRTMGLVYKNLHWLVVEPPSWKIWVRQWEGWHPNIMEKKSSLKPPTSTKLDDFVRANVGICMYKYSSTMVSCYMGVTSTKLDPPTVQLGKTYRKPWILWKLVSFLQMFPKTPNSWVSGM